MNNDQDSTGRLSVLEQYDAEECQSSEATWLSVTWQSPEPWTVAVQAQQGSARLLPINLATQYIEDHYTEDLSLEHVAHALHVPASGLAQLFEEAMGIAFFDYVACVRVEKAKNLLLNPNYYFTEIASELGFESIRDFSQMFTRMVGEPPHAYRARLRARLCCVEQEL